MAKAKTSPEEKFTNVDFDLFKAIEALDRKDYGYFDRLTEEQQRKFNPYMLLKYMSSAKGRTDLQHFHVLGTNEFANTHMFNENIHRHPRLQWLMLCTAGLGAGKQFHPWIPQIKENVSRLKEKATAKDIREYFTKVYPNSDEETLAEVSKLFVAQQHKKMYLADKYPELKVEDINLLADLVTDIEIQQHEKDSGN